MTRKTPARGRALAATLALLAVPPLVALAEGVAFHRHNRPNLSLVSSGERREALLHVPRTLDPAAPTPLVVSLHGAGGWPALERDLTGWDATADREGFLVAYPAGVGGWGTRGWRVQRREGLRKDVRFVEDLIDAIGSRYPLDPDRIYVDGLSNGGGMAFALSCSIPDRLAAVGMVAAAQTLPWNWCPDPSPVPMIDFHGTADPVVPYEGGSSWIGAVVFPDVEDWAARWARRNGCGIEPGEVSVAVDVTRRTYEGCAADASVTLYTIRGGGHTWPGGMPLPEWFLGPTSRGVDATERMWAFFRAHPRSRREGAGS